MTKRDMARRRGDSGGHSVKQKAIGVEGDGGGGPVEAVFVETGGGVEGEGGGGEGGGVGGVVVCGAGGGGLEDEVEGVGRPRGRGGAVGVCWWERNSRSISWVSL